MGLLASCEKEVQDPAEGPETAGIKTVLKVGIDPGTPETKTYMGALVEGVHKVYWSNGDQIAVNGVASEELSGLPENTSNAAFTINGLISAPYKILYPASIYTDATHVTLPAVQTYKAGNFADGMFPMAGYSASPSGTLSMGHLCAVVKISVLRETAEHAEARSGEVDTDKIVAVRFSGNNSEQVSGAFEINYETPALTAASGTGDDLVVSVAKSQSTSTSTPKDYYLVVPARTYSSGFTITVKDAKGDIMTKSKASSWTPVAGKLYNMTAFEFVPTGTDTGIEIDSAEDLIAFAEAYNNKSLDYYYSGDDVLVATLTGDITFDATSSAAFNATGGIGMKNNLFGASEDYYFNGFFNGGDHTISGLTATVPLFAAVGGGGHVKDLTIDNTCSFTFTHPNTVELDAGAVIGYHKGELKNVEVEANVSLVAGEVSQETCLGGIAGRIVEGVVDGCSYSGAITVPAGFQSAEKKIQMGGIVGRISNASGQVLNTDFEGTIYNRGQMIVDDEEGSWKNNPYLMIGGIVGLNAGTVDGCSVSNHATGVTVTLTDTESADHDYTGTIVTHSTNAYHYAMGGIAGRNDATVKDCTNNAAVLNIFSAARGASGNMNGRFVDLGGIAGYNGTGATVSGSHNNGTLVNRAVPKVQCIGGVVGKNFGTVSSSSNNSTGTIEVATSYFDGPDGPRMPYIGGVIGISDAAATLSDIQNAANITVSQIENTAGIMVNIGGVIGKSEGAFDGSANSGTISNSGNIEVTHAGVKCTMPTAENDYGLFLGGISGYATANIKNVSNSGDVTYVCTNTGSAEVEGGSQYVYLGGIVGKVKGATHSARVDVEYCSNSGTLTHDPTSTAPNSATCFYQFNYLGGIAGYAEFVNIKGDSINKSTNSGNITGGCTPNEKTSYNDDTFFVGGIVGYLNGRNSSVSYCDLTGTAEVYNNHWTNRSVTNRPPMCGGIAGVIYGTSANHATISNCTIESTVTVTGRRGIVGGIVGWARGGTVSDCTVNVSLTPSSYGIAGIAGRTDYADISSCTFNGTNVTSGNAQKVGGIVAIIGNASCTIDGCSSYATTISSVTGASGAIAGTSYAGSTIQNCHYKSGKDICGDSNFTDGGGNEDNL